jgi:predicted nucleic acid-binding protein
VIQVVADADTLFGATTRGLLIHLDYSGLIRLHWSPLILAELSRALVQTGRKPNAKAAATHERLMRAALPHAEVPVAVVQKQFRAVAAAMHSAKDMHVAACAHAIVAGNFYPTHGAVSLVTNNVRDFGVRRLAAIGIKVSRPDTFLFDLFQRDAQGVATAFAALRATLRSAPSPEQLLERLAADGQVKTAAAMFSAEVRRTRL